MPVLLRDVSAQLAQWELLPLKPAGQMSIAAIRFKGVPPSIQLVPKERVAEVWTPFPPSVYRGTGVETRLGIMLCVPDDVRQDLEALEEWVRGHMKAVVPDIDSIWKSSTRPPGKYTSALKAKITVAGPYACQTLDIDGRSAPMPTDWHRLTCIPLIEVRGAYLQKGAAGLVLEVGGLMLGEHMSQVRLSADDFL